MKIQLQLTRNESNATHFTFYSVNSGAIVLEKEIGVNEIHIIDVEDEFTNFTIQHNGNNNDFNFVSSSVE